jgi:histidinol phosphatase-like enzyme
MCTSQGHHISIIWYCNVRKECQVDEKNGGMYEKMGQKS